VVYYSCKDQRGGIVVVEVVRDQDLDMFFEVVVLFQ
jgi:hypothetical protein